MMWYVINLKRQLYSNNKSNDKIYGERGRLKTSVSRQLSDFSSLLWSDFQPVALLQPHYKPHFQLQLVRVNNAKAMKNIVFLLGATEQPLAGEI